MLNIKKSSLNAISGGNRSGKSRLLKDIYNELKPKEVIYITDDYKLLDDINSKIKYILIDDLCSNITKRRTKEIINKLINYKEQGITIIVTTINLSLVQGFDYFFIIDNYKVILEGLPKDILILDNKLSKLGLEIPLMYDLSTKLKDYNIINDTITDMQRMIDTIWK